MLLQLALAFVPPLPFSQPAALPVAHPSVSQDDPFAARYTEKKLRSAWKRLDEGERFDIVEALRLELALQPSFQMGLVAHSIASADKDPGLFAEAGAPPVFDSADHTPKEPVRRRALDPKKAKVVRVVEKMVPVRPLKSAWSYDWSRGEVVRSGSLGSEAATFRLFENALVGIPHDADLAEALILAQLDRGEERKAQVAFGHSYCDRTGGIFPGVTLYDAWASGKTVEMPDVDSLGLIFELEGSYGRYKAPLSGSRQRKLYEKLSEHFQKTHRYRALREAMARIYAVGSPLLPEGYGPNLDRFHALWDFHASDAKAIAEDLPTAAKWERYLEKWVRRCERDESLMARGLNRRATLERDGAWVRATLERVMEREGALKGKR